MGNDSRNFWGRGVILIAELHHLSGSPGREMAIVDICVGWVLVRLLLVHCISARLRSDSTPDSRRVHF